MDLAIKNIPESVELEGVSNYMIWSYKVKMILMRRDYGKFWRMLQYN
jgi:hypothetical protein